jgi:ribonuclease VapC
MVIDSSVLVAIALEEPGFLSYLDVISNAPNRNLSAASLLETCIVVNREKGAVGLLRLRQLLSDADIQIVDFTEAQSAAAFAAHLRYGKGMGHPAQLNILDCCSYALASSVREPLLFKGNDFGHTDIAVA